MLCINDLSFLNELNFRYEIGVLFLPKQFSQTTFPLVESPSFPIPYDLPPVKYQTSGQFIST